MRSSLKDMNDILINTIAQSEKQLDTAAAVTSSIYLSLKSLYMMYCGVYDLQSVLSIDQSLGL